MKANFFPQLGTHYCASTNQLKSWLSILITGGLIRSRHFVEHFLGYCFHSGCSNLAISTFAATKKRNVSLQNLILRGLGNYGLYEDVLSVYKNCRALGCPSDDFTIPVVIKACTILGAFWSGEQIHGLVLKSGYGKNVVVETALVDFYAKSGFLGHARSLIDEIPQPDLVSLNALLAGYSLHGLDHEALRVFKRVFVLGLNPNSSTLATVIPVCSRSGRLDFGRSLHGYAVKSGFFTTDVLVPALISMYAAAGRSLHLSAARTLFDDCFPRKNVAVWNAMISAYAQNQMPVEAIAVFQEMLRCDVEPDLITFVSIIPSCDLVHDSSSYSESLHGFVIKHGSELKIPVTTALVSMYAKLGDLSKAELLFSSMPYRTLLSWNIMVSGYVHSGQWYTSKAAFREMQLAGVSPDSASIVSILSACDEMEAKSAHGFSIRKGIDSSINVSNALLGFYSECNDMTYCFNFFQRMEEAKDIISWNTMISARVHCGELEEAIRLLQQMQKEGMRMDLVTLISILPICGDLYDVKAVHCYAIKSGVDSDVSLVNALITMYCKWDEGEETGTGRWLFESLTKKSVVSWNSLISGYIQHDRINEAWILFGRMMTENQWLNSVTLLNLLPLCCCLLQVKSIHGYSIRRCILLSQEIPLLTSLISAYSRLESIESCISLFSRRKCNDVSLWNAIISAHVQTQNPEKAVEFFLHGLIEMGLKPDDITLLSLMSATSQLNSSRNLIDSIMAYALIKKGFGSDTAINNALIDSYAKTGNISFARLLFEEFPEKNVESWNVMINGYGLHGDGESAVELFSQMQSAGLRPDHITFSNTLSACSHAGLVPQGLMVFDSMAEMGLPPRIEQYGCMVDLLSRTGHLMEACDIIESLEDGKWKFSLLESLLGACRAYGDVHIAERVHRMMTTSANEPHCSASYVTLSNVYAGVGRWEDAGGARSNVDRKNLKKPVGFSVV